MPVFADASYWIAMLNHKDQHAARARAASERLGRHGIMTSEMVLTEVTNSLAGFGENARAAVTDLIREMRADPAVTIIPQTTDLFQQALEFYATHKDKQWGLTDCSSFCIMRERRIRDALAYDKHFEQAGFAALLRAED